MSQGGMIFTTNAPQGGKRIQIMREGVTSTDDAAIDVIVIKPADEEGIKKVTHALLSLMLASETRQF